MIKKPIKENIINCLKKGSLVKSDLIEKVSSTTKTTIQGVYKELRKLSHNGVILIHKDRVSLNLLFINKEYEKWSEVLKNYEGGENLKRHFVDLKDGESLSLKFNSLNDLDAYWVHIYIVLHNKLEKGERSYSIVPHDWFYYARKETDEYWTKKQKDKSRLIITHPVEIDKEVARERNKQSYEVLIGLNPLNQPEDIYYTLLGGFIFKITISKNLNKKLTEFIKNNKKINVINSEEVKELIKKRGVCKMKISKDIKKYNKIISKIKKYFE